jgi:hypothetical protein
MIINNKFHQANPEKLILESKPALYDEFEPIEDFVIDVVDFDTKKYNNKKSFSKMKRNKFKRKSRKAKENKLNRKFFRLID